MTGSITIETDVFEHREVKPYFINPCCFGEDFAHWLKGKLLLASGHEFILSDVIQEDYGWGFWASRAMDRFWVALSYVGDGPQESPAQWVVSVDHDPGLNIIKRLFSRTDCQSLQELRFRIQQILNSHSGIKVIRNT